MDSVPAVATSAAVRFTCRIVLFIKPVGRFVLFTLTTDCGAKLVPVTTNSTPDDPARTGVGEMDVIVGTLLGAGGIVSKRSGRCASARGREHNHSRTRTCNHLLEP